MPIAAALDRFPDVVRPDKKVDADDLGRTGLQAATSVHAEPAEDERREPSSTHEDEGKEDEERQRQLAAATAIQRRWKGHHVRSEKPKLSSDERWKQVLFNAEGVKRNEDAADGKNDAKDRWHRALHATSQLQNGKAFSSSGGDDDSSSSTAVLSKTLEEQHWLELMDPKHRYGSNLKHYHQAWQDDEDTQDHFFKWLDRGAGKEVSLPECSREQLEKERITYLSVDQRLNYYVVVDKSNGKIKWFKNGSHVDTAPRKWKDGGPDVGIVPKESDEEEDEEAYDSDASSLSSSASSLQSNQAQHYTGKDRSAEGPLGQVKEFFEKFTLKGATDRVLRKTVGKNTWIFVADLDFNLFVGLKSTGAFQHSSFLAGGRVSAAGLITVRDGLITSLSPLSGHYRTKIDHFKEFLRQMEKQGADLSKVKLTKAELLMFGIEKYGKATKSVGKAKKAVLHPHRAAVEREKAAEQTEAKRKPQAHTDDLGDNAGSLADFKRNVLYGRKKAGTGRGAHKAVEKMLLSEKGAKGKDGDTPAPKQDSPGPRSSSQKSTDMRASRAHDGASEHA